MSNNNCSNVCDCIVCNCDDCADDVNNFLLSAGGETSEIVFENDQAVILDTTSSTVQMFPTMDGFSYELVSENTDICTMTEDGSLTFDESGNVIVDVYNDQGEYVGRYRVTAILGEDGINRFAVGYMCNCDDEEDSGKSQNIYYGVNILYQNDKVIVLDSPYDTVAMFPEENRYQYELVGGNSAISQANADGSITFKHNGSVVVKILNSEGTFKGYYRVTAILTGTGMNRFSIAYLCCWDEESDTTDTNLMSIDICDSDGVSLLDYTDGFTINMLEQYQFTCHIYYQSSEQTIIWSTSTPQLIEVSDDGLVTAKDSGVAILRAAISGSKVYCEANLSIEVGEYWITKEQILSIGWTNANITDAVVEDINRVLKKYEINTAERRRHFFGQCYVESGGDSDYIENIQPDGNIYWGAGAIQMTGKYHYLAFASYLILQHYPTLNGQHHPAAHYGDQIAQYECICDDATKNQIDLRKFTDIVDIGSPYVASRYPWESAGYYWKFTDLNELADDAIPGNQSGVDAISLKINSGGGEESRAKRYASYLRVCEII